MVKIVQQSIDNDMRGYAGIKTGLDEAPKQKTTPTTTGKWWSESTKEVTVMVGGVERAIKTNTKSQYTKRVIFFGSSSTEGQGASTTANSYSRLLQTRLNAKGYEVYNRGIGGDWTGTALNRFFTDVTPLCPDIVVFAFTLGNDGIYVDDKYTKYKQFRNNLLKLLNLSKQYGITPIVMTQAPTQLYTPEIYAWSKQLTIELESMGIHMVDWNGAVDDLTGQPMTQAVFDQQHYNDKGHTEICNSFPVTLFDVAAIQKGGYLTSPKGYVRFGTPTTQTPIVFTPDYQITTFSTFMRFRKDTLPTIAHTLKSFGDTTRVVMNPDGSIEYRSTISGTQVIQATSLADNQWHSLAVTYSPIDQQARFYVDGVLKTTKGGVLALDKLCIGGRTSTADPLKNCDIKDVAVYKTRLTPERVMSTHEGTISQTSLELFSPMHDKTITQNVVLSNLAPTLSNLQVNAGETGLTVVNSTIY